MSYQLLEGKTVSEHVKSDVCTDVEKLIRDKGIKPGLAFIRVGEHPASKVYVRTKVKSSQEVGIFSEEIALPENITQELLLKKIQELNHRNDIHGILVQHPLPGHLDEGIVYETILPQKDVDGFHPYNMGRILIGDPLFVPCTPLGILEIFKWYKIETSGRHVVVVGRSNIVGKPIAALMFQKNYGTNATVTVCHTGTRNLSEYTKKADIIIAAVGKPRSICSDMVSKGVVIIDVGVNRVEDNTLPKGYRILGDVDFEEVSKKASAITPVPGGVGLMTVAMLLKNTVKAAQLSCRK